MSDNTEMNDLIKATPALPSDQTIADDILNESDVKKMQNLVQIFNLNQAKKNVIRVFQYNAILDKLSDEALKRVTNHPGEFSNNDLFNFMQTMQASIDRANKSLNLVSDVPAIQFNQVNNINMSENQLDRTSKDKIKAAVKAILAKSKDLNILDNDEEIIIEEDEDVNNSDDTTVLNNNLLKDDEEET